MPCWRANNLPQNWACCSTRRRSQNCSTSRHATFPRCKSLAECRNPFGWAESFGGDVTRSKHGSRPDVRTETGRLGTREYSDVTVDNCETLKRRDSRTSDRQFRRIPTSSCRKVFEEHPAASRIVATCEHHNVASGGLAF